MYSEYMGLCYASMEMVCTTVRYFCGIRWDPQQPRKTLGSAIGPQRGPNFHKTDFDDDAMKVHDSLSSTQCLLPFDETGDVMIPLA